MRSANIDAAPILRVSLHQAPRDHCPLKILAASGGEDAKVANEANGEMVVERLPPFSGTQHLRNKLP